MAVKCILTGQEKVNLSGDTMTGDLKVGSSSIGINGYIEGTRLKTTEATESAGDFATIDGDGWVYKRAPANVLGDIGGQAKITANGILKGDGTGNITAADETEVELVDITPELIGAQPKIIANGFLTSDGEGNVGSENPVLTVEVQLRGAPTQDETGQYIYDFGSNYNYEQIRSAQHRGYMVVVYYSGDIFYYTGENSNDGLIFSKIGKRYSTCSYDRLRCTSDDKWHQESNTLVSEEGIFPAANGRFTLPEIIQNLQTSVQDAAPYTKICSVSVPTANWQGPEPYTQSISCDYNVTSLTMANIQLSDVLYDQLVADNVTYLNIANSDGRLFIKAKGGKPSVDLTLQITCTEIR